MASRRNPTCSGFESDGGMRSIVPRHENPSMSPQSRSIDHLPEWARELIADARVAHLGLLDSNYRPRVLPVTFAACGGSLWSAVDHKRKSVVGRDLARVRWLRRNPAAALTVDRYSDDWERLAWVQALGTIDVLEEAEPAALAALRAKYEQYRDRPPAGPFMRLVPERLLCWSADAL
jgi:PPOX class probable F420-dependent enzyme